MLNFKKKILIVSHDAGGAEIISHFVKKYRFNPDFYLKGPAKKIFKANLKKIKTIKSIKSKLNNYKIVIVGTSLNNDFEYNVIKYSLKKKIKVISFIDHWVNYLNRFIRNGKLILPNEIIVGDKDAYKIAKKKFKDVKITYYKNYYFDSFKSKLKKIKNIQKILYVSSNMDTFKGKIVSDKKILSQVISKIQSNKVIKRKKMLFIRKHPSEKYHKYKYLKNFKSNLIIKIDKNFALKDSFKDTSFVIGYDSMALVVAKIYGLKTINLYVDKKNNKIPKKYIDYYLKIKK